MRHRLLILIALVLALAAGCKKSEYNNTTSSTTDTTYTDTSATTTPTGTTSTAASTLSEDDKEFATKAAQGNMSEVSLGSMAAQKGTSPDVKAFGNRMVNDHGKALDELKQLAANKGITLPADVDTGQKATADKLSKYSGKQFDKAYADTMADDHEKDVKEFDKASKNAQDPDLKAWAAKTLPVIQDHFKMAQAMKDKLK